MSLIVAIAAILISALIFFWLLKIVKMTLQTAIFLAIMVLVLQLFFGIGPQQVLDQIAQFFQAILRALTGQ